MKYKRNWYKSPLQGWVKFRSSWEYAYAKWLNRKKVLWLYEPHLFPIGELGYYLPDFYLVKEDRYVEIKGFMQPKAKRKIEAFRKLYTVDFEILYGEDLIDMGVKICI